MIRQTMLSLIAGLFMFTNVIPAGAFHEGQSSGGGTVSAQADPYSGGANFGVPVDVAPGRAGIEPNIQLQYSSGLPNGILGVGWSLELGSIQRSTKKGVPSYTDSDTFVLLQNGGTQELVFDALAGFYRAKQEGAFMKTEFVLNTYWRVTDKKGTRYYFGEDQASREYDPAATARVFKWALNRVEDLNGNSMTVSYLKMDNKLYPSEIHYTGNSQTGSLPFARVLFNYNVNPNQRVSFISGFQVKTTQRLSQINVYGGGVLQRIYKFNYSQSAATGRSLISSVVHYAADQTSALPAKSFVYQSVKPVYSPVQPVPGSAARFAGDFNGDGLGDVALLTSSSGQVDVALSNGGSFGLPQNWISGFGINANIISGDFNADGRADIGSFDAAMGIWKIAYSFGNYFGGMGTWITGFGANGQPSTGDFNGDGLTDIFVFSKNGANLHARIAVNKGGSFEPLTGFDFNIGAQDDIPLTFDFNGDGLTDLVSFDKASGRWFVYWNAGDRNGKFTLLQTITGFAVNYNPVVADFNADNLPDIGYFDPATGNIVYRVSDEFSFSGTNLVFSTGFNIPGPDAQVQSADFNGDGLADFAGHNPQGDKEVRFSGGSGTPLDLLTSIANGVGAVTTITYQPSTRYANTYLPFVLSLVKSVENANGRGDVYQTRYSYAGGYWDKTDREFRGFATVTVTDPQNNYARTRFLQDSVFKGRPVTEEKFDAAGNLFAKTENTWRVQEIAPGINFVSPYGKSNFVYDGNASGRRTLEEYFYEETPQLGNLTRIVQYGEVDLATGNDIPGDNRTVETVHVNNTSVGNWLIGLPRLTTVKNQSHQIVRQTWFDYDNQANTAAPVKGLLTKKEDWAGGGIGAVNPVTQYSYDAIGNLLTTTDPKGNVTSVSYDTTHKMFPLTTANAIGHQVVNEYFGVNGVPLTGIDGLSGFWGQVRSTTDPNQQQGRRGYDLFGRPAVTISPLDSVQYPTQTTEIQYNADYTKVTTRQRIKNGQPQMIEAVSFYDGFDRLIQTKTPSEVAGRYVVGGQGEYDSRGLKIKQYLPYFSTSLLDTIVPIDPLRPHSTVEYDAMGRPVKTINPDGTYASAAYDDWSTAAVNENGHKQASYFDAWGRLIKKEEYTGADGRSPNYPASPYTLYAATLYTYDSEGNLLQTKDAYNNTTTITYDALGRKTAMNDPDMGAWSYAYDINGNLTKQIDAKGQTLTFTYDALNRLTNKTDGTGGSVNVNYAYDTATVTNAKGRLTQAAYSGGNTQFAYDALGRELQSIKTMNLPAGQAGTTNYQVNRGYDALNNLLQIQYPDQKNIYYKYNPAGQIEAISNDAAILPLSFNWQEEKTEQLVSLVKREAYLARDTSDGIRATKTLLLTIANWLERNLLGVGDAEAHSLLESFKQESSANGLVSIEAEDYNGNVPPAAGTPTWNFVITTGQSGSRSLKANPNSGVNNDMGYTTKSPRLDYKIKFVKTGAHYIWIRGIGATTNDDSLHAGLDGQALTTSDRITGFTTSWKWSKTTMDAGAVATINVATAGEHTLNLWMREDGMVIDKVVVTSSATYVPSGTGPAQSPQFPPVAPVLNTATAGNAQVSLNWATVSGATGYKVKYGTAVGSHTTTVSVGNVLTRAVTGLTNGTAYYFVVTAYNAAGESPNSNELSATPQAVPLLPQPWNHQDIGAAGIAGSTGYAAGVFTVNASGSDIWGTVDAFRYVYQTLNGDGEIVAQVTGVTNTNLWAKAGVMMRENLTAGSRHTMMVITPGNGSAFQRRVTTGGISTNNNGDTVRVPYWVKLARSGNTFKGYKSADGVNWVQVGPMETITMPSAIYVGLAVTSHNNFALNTSTISNVSVSVRLAAPVLNTATVGDTQVTLSWAATTGATGYKIYYGTATGQYGAPVTVSATTTTVTGLANGTTYYFVVTAYNAAGESPNSNERSAVPVAPAESATLFVKNVDYNASGQMTKIEYGNGDVTTYTYNPLNLRLTRLYTVNAQLQPVQDLNYTYDSAGNILSIIDNVNTADQTFKYDELNRLVEAANPNVGSYGSKSYAYDKIGNIVAKDGKTYFYGAAGAGGGPHAVTALSDGTTFAYDANGNMVTKVEAGVTTAYAYDAENRLTKVVKNGSTIGQYEYDGDGGRTKKTATVAGQTTTATFVGSLFETSGPRNTRFIFLGGQRVAAVTSTPSIGTTVLYYHSDHLGGANVLTDATGFKKELIEYEPFGQESRHEKYGSSEEVAWYYFTGKPKDDETGLYYYGARYYDPSLGRFITADTIVQSSDNPQTFNRYTYSGNNPVNNIDSDGHWFFAAIFAIIKAASAYAVAHPIIAGAIAGGVLGGANAAINGTNIAQGIGLGVLGGAIGGGVGLGVGSFLEKGFGTFAAGLIGSGLGGATAGAATLAILGGDVGMGALAGLAGGVIAFSGSRVWPLGADAVAGGVSSVIQGGEFGEGAKMGAIDNALATMMALVMPTETAGNQEKQPGDLVFIKPGKMDLVGWGISFLEGGAFSHVGIVTDNQNMVSAGPAKGVGYQKIESYNNRQARINTRFRGNQNVINAAKAQTVAKLPYNYVFGGRGRVCSTTCGNAISVGAGIPWTGIGPNSQFNVFKSYGE